MATDSHGYYYPALSGATGADYPADMQQLVSTLTDHTILWATDAADRDSRYSTDSAGIVVVSTVAPYYVWLKTGTGSSWVTLYKDTGWVSDGFTIASGWTNGGWMKARNRSGDIEINVELTRNGTDLTASSIGNIGDQTILTVPAQFTPTNTTPGRLRCTNTSGNVDLTSGGAVILTDFNPGSTIANSDFARLHFKFLEG